jgi:hypothetical protein
MRLILALILMVPMLASAVERDLDDCTIGATPTALAPLDLDNCTFDDGDEITGILTGLVSTYGNVYVRAPSRTAWVVAAYTAFTVDDFYFLEDQSARNTFLIQHKVVNPATCSGNDCKGFFTLWSFSNFDNVVIGGPKLSVTLQGNHPGLANCSTHYRPATETGYNAGAAAICDINYGFVGFSMTDSSTATLADVRANLKFTQGYAVYTTGSITEGGTTNKITQLNVAGLFFATSGTFFHQGVKNAWSDPDRYVLSDPFVRAYGWTGTTGTQTDNGLPVGCNDSDNKQVRASGFAGYYTDSITGGMTVDYGMISWVQRFASQVGVSQSEPYIVRLKDWGISGPGTSYPAGVRVKWTNEANMFKGDPHDAGTSGVVQRWVRFQKLPDTYGSGPSSASGTGCDEVYNPGNSNFARLENSVTGRANRDWDVTFSGNWLWPHGGHPLLRFAWDASASYGHTMRLASGTTINSTITLHDRSTVTGPGTYSELVVADYNTNVPGANSSIVNTNVAGAVTISADTEGTTISNVNFTGSARAVITIGSSADATVDDLCVPNGSTITGTGTLTYEGGSQSLPYTIPNGTNNCNITANDRPDPPGVN